MSFHIISGRHNISNIGFVQLWPWRFVSFGELKWDVNHKVSACVRWLQTPTSKQNLHSFSQPFSAVTFKGIWEYESPISALHSELFILLESYIMCEFWKMCIEKQVSIKLRMEETIQQSQLQKTQIQQPWLCPFNTLRQFNQQTPFSTGPLPQTNDSLYLRRVRFWARCG